MSMNYPPLRPYTANFALLGHVNQKNPQVLLANAADTLEQTAALTSATR
jgi:hypothetical protein